MLNSEGIDLGKLTAKKKLPNIAPLGDGTKRVNQRNLVMRG
jgi:hypothetical protein